MGSVGWVARAGAAGELYVFAVDRLCAAGVGDASIDGQFDPFRNGYDKGLSNQQFPQRFSGALVLPLHERKGPKAVRLVLDGWRVLAIGTASSGAPYSYKIFGGTYLKGGRESINGSGGATYLPTVGRNTLRLAPGGRSICGWGGM